MLVEVVADIVVVAEGAGSSRGRARRRRQRHAVTELESEKDGTTFIATTAETESVRRRLATGQVRSWGATLEKS